MSSPTIRQVLQEMLSKYGDCFTDNYSGSFADQAEDIRKCVADAFERSFSTIDEHLFMFNILWLPNYECCNYLYLYPHFINPSPYLKLSVNQTTYIDFGRIALLKGYRAKIETAAKVTNSATVSNFVLLEVADDPILELTEGEFYQHLHNTAIMALEPNIRAIKDVDLFMEDHYPNENYRFSKDLRNVVCNNPSERLNNALDVMWRENYFDVLANIEKHQEIWRQN